MNNINLKRGQYLSQVEPFLSHGIPSDTIIYKEVPGAGITTYAYKYFKQHVICCLPNRPVIEDKVKRHNAQCKPSETVLGVYKGITYENIVEYLTNDEVIYKKILTTPEGFIDKVVLAFGDNYELMLSQYFFLLDECERVITDVSYRGKIAAPIDFFFKFQHKALVSATVLPFSDPRFELFKKLYIKPDYDYSKLLTLVDTNNVVEAVRKRLKELNSDHVLIFLNSTDTIYDLMQQLNIADKSHVYCSEKSASKLFLKKFKNADWDLEVDRLAKYNFFTSRFFSAFDISLNYKPDVIVVTDVYFAEHSVVDPQTEIIQIAGRCRNGIESLTHVTNFNAKIQSKPREEALQYLNGCFDTYQWFLDFEKKVENQGAKDMLRKAIEESMAHNFYTEGRINSFMVDNYLHEERVKGYYQQVEHLKAAYAKRPKHFVVVPQPDYYTISDEDRRTINSKTSIKELRKEVAHQLDRIASKEGEFYVGSLEYANFIRGVDPNLTKAYEVIGLEGLEQTGYVNSRITKAVNEAKTIAAIEKMAPIIHSMFCEHSIYTENEIKNTLFEVQMAEGITGKVYATHIKRFYEARRTTHLGIVVWALREQRVLIS